MKKCYVIAGGDFDGFYDEIGPDDLVIAADKGYVHANAAGLTPKYIIGDFDSALTPELSNVIKLNPIKDDTDTKSAIKLALKKGYDEIIIYGGLGGRESHTLANIRLLLEYKKQGINISLRSAKKKIFVINDRYEFKFKDEDNFYVSIFALSDMVEAITIKGLFYELDHYDMSLDDSLGVSNETCGKDFTISLESGYLLLIFESKDA